MAEKNPANAIETRTSDKVRIPMSIPLRKLEVPEIPGYHLHWMSGTPGRLAQALRAGYEFVDADEVEVNNFNVATDMGVSGSTDMGSRVSLTSGDEGNILYLMKIKEEFFEEDQEKLAAINDRVAAQLRSEPSGENTYIPQAHRKAVADLFTPKNRR